MRQRNGMQTWKAVLVIALLLGAAGAAGAAGTWQTFTLDNGLGVLIKEEPAAPVVALNIWIHVGSRNEKPGQEGFSHLIEHMLFKGTPTYPTGQLDKEIKKLGASQNAFTSLDYTCYHVLGAKEHFPRLMELEADAVLNSLFDPVEFAREVQVVLEEMRMDKDEPQSKVYNMVKEAAYTTHPYRHPVVGYHDVLASATRDQVFDYYKTYYTPPNMFVVVVGDVQTAEALEIVKRHMGAVTGKPKPDQTVPAEPPQDRRREVREFGDLQQAYVTLAWHAPGIASPDNYVMDVISALMGSGRSSRLVRTLVEDEKLVSSVRSSYYTSQDPSQFLIMAELPQGNVGRFIERAARLMADLGVDPLKAERGGDGVITPEEIDKAKQQLIASTIFSRETAESQAFNYGHYATLGKLGEADAYIDRIKRVSLDDIRRLAKETFTDWNLTVARLEPQLASGAMVPEMITLENGVRLILKENHSSPLVAMAVQIDAGGLREERREAGLANLTAATLLKGTEGKKAEEIAQAFEAMGTTVECKAQKSFTTFKMQALAEKFLPSLDLCLEVLTKADFPEAEFRKEQDLALEKLKAEEDNLFPYIYYKSLSAIFPDYPVGYSSLGTPEDVRALRRSDCAQFFRKHFVGPGMVISLVGDFYLAEIKDQLVKRFEALPKGNPGPLREPKLDPVAKPIEVVGQKNRQQSQILVATRTFPRHDPRMVPMDVLRTILSGSMASRLFTNLRDKRSLAYSVWATNVGTRTVGYFFATLSTAVGKLDEARTALIEELEAIRTGGFTDEEFEDAKKYLLGQYALSLVDNISQADAFSSDEFFGVGFDYYRKYPDLIRNVTKEAVMAIAQEFLLGKGAYVVGVTKP